MTWGGLGLWLVAVVLGLVTANNPSTGPGLVMVIILFPVPELALRRLAPDQFGGGGYGVLTPWLALVAFYVTDQGVHLQHASLWQLSGFWALAVVLAVLWTAVAAPAIHPAYQDVRRPVAVTIAFGAHTVLLYCALLQWNVRMPQAATQEFTGVVVAKEHVNGRMSRRLLTVNWPDPLARADMIDAPRELFESAKPGDPLRATVHPGRLGQAWVRYTLVP